MQSLKDELVKKLLEKTKELGHQVTSSEMRADEGMPNPNEYAFYYGSFDKAAEKVFLMFSKGEELVAFDQRVKGVKIVSKKPVTTLSPERREVVMAEVVDIFIKNDGIMPSHRDIKKNMMISIKEWDAIRRENGFSETAVRKMAEAKTGRKFLTPNERRMRDKLNRKRLVEEADKPKPQVKEGTEVASVIGRRRQVRLSDEQCKNALERACKKAGHVLTEKEVLECYGMLPGWTVLQKRVGPWFTWDELFGLPFINEKKAAKAMERKKAYLEQAEVQEAKEEPLKAAEVVIEEVETPEAVEADEMPEVVEAEETPEAIETDEKADEMVEIPIKLILPKGIKGTVKITLKI